MYKITVHDFVAVEGASTSRTAIQLERARQLCASHRASDASRAARSKESSVASRQALPISPRSTTLDDRDKVYNHFRDLQDFESTDFQTSLVPSRINGAESSRHGKRIQDAVVTAHELAKRPRRENVSILNLIPQPHFIQAPAVDYRPVDTTKIPPYHKALPLPVPPYDTAAVNELLTSSCRRGAWLIPVRGSLPWEGASTAVILEGTQVASRSSSPCLPVPAAQPHAIVWTPDALQHLWAFLGAIQRAEHLGPLSLSFHAAPPITFSTAMSEPVWESNQPYYHEHSSKHTTGSSDVFAADICKAQLEGVDYIKVYHDVPYSLSLRNILDAYRHEQVDGQAPGRSGANDRKIRMLKGARLVFMDERSKPAFLM